MAVDILNTLTTLDPHYRGAIFLTYTVNLPFFEEIVAPKLDALGCTNVIILADQHGYDEALLRGGRHLRRVGRQYVCAPVVREGHGVQHAKAILLVGPQHGLLLVGSGNLTLSGIGRNLEQFIRFDLDRSSGEVTSFDRYPFQVVWQLIDKICQQMNIASTLTDRVQAVRELAPWLEMPADPPPNIRLWHSFDRAIFSQWQDRTSVEELRLLSPFWTLNTIDEMVNRFHPRRLILGADEREPRLDGLALQQMANNWQCDLTLMGVTGPPDEQRYLHAKTYIGKSTETSWCLTGSANCTVPALHRSWQDGGNLELAIWQQADDSAAFDGIWADELLALSTLDLTSLQHHGEDEPPSLSFPFRLNELRYENGRLSGQIFGTSFAPNLSGEWWLELQRSGDQLLIIPEDDGWFSLAYENPLDGSEAGRVFLRSLGQENQASPWHWIDQPGELIRFGNRTYHARVEASLQTFSGAGQLFEELLNFLWQRVDPRQLQVEEDGDGSGRRNGRDRHDSSSESDDSEQKPPPASAFITDEELTNNIVWRAGGYAPHNQSVNSLRDLLSLALLRLTVETKPDGQETSEGETPDESNTEHEKQLNKERKKVLQQLCDYVHRYCRRYAARLAERDFLTQVGPTLLFENHFTLGRILLEFYEKVQIFTDKDLRRCLVLILGALFWPEAAGLHGKGGWQIFLGAGYEIDQLQEEFRNSALPELIVVLMAEGWGNPKSWKQTQYRKQLVQQYMLGQELIHRMESSTDQESWRSFVNNFNHTRDIFGFRNLGDLSGNATAISIEERLNYFKMLTNYRTPTEEKYQQIQLWHKAYQMGLQNRPEAKSLEKTIVNDLGYAHELGLVKKAGSNSKFLCIVGDKEYCPSCYVRLPLMKQQALKNNKLELCPNCTRAVLYWKPALSLDAV